MKRHRQTLEGVLDALSIVETTWEDEHARRVLDAVATIHDEGSDPRETLAVILDRDFDAGLTLIGLVLACSKDELNVLLRAALSPGGIGVTRYTDDRATFLDQLAILGVFSERDKLRQTPITWRELLRERLRTGRGSAIKGQVRGRRLEDFTERILRDVLEDVSYDVRCRFVGAKGTSTEKADFAIPSRADARILIEVKAYGATGSKQTDILGDITRIVQEKRDDTDWLLVTDGVTWKARANDLRKLIAVQNQGQITRIYTQRMEADLREDLKQLRSDHDL